ncbi:hypothetical protein T484DRAFT_1942966, partial [Baffinella frigidus]
AGMLEEGEKARAALAARVITLEAIAKKAESDVAIAREVARRATDTPASLFESFPGVSTWMSGMTS